MQATLQALTGVPLRLAQSGAQFGRDASSALSAGFGIAMEAKRYDRAPSLQVVAGKAILGGHALSGSVDLWVLGATAEIGDDVVRKTEEVLEQRGISLLVLDWSEQAVPRLAALLAIVPEATCAWWETAQPITLVADVAAVLADIRAHPAFSSVAARIQAECAEPLMGLGTLRRSADAWLRARLVSARASKRSFGQVVAVSPEGPSLVGRPALQQHLENAVAHAAAAGVAAQNLTAVGGGIDTSTDTSPTVVVIVGDEGTGKSWLMLRWWAQQETAPILIFIAGRRAHVVAEVGPAHPLRALARLLAEQEARDDPTRIEQWYRRLHRWATRGPSPVPRFLIVLDGLNEHPFVPWADLVPAYADAARALGGVLVVTARPTYWADVRRRLGDDITVHEVEVPEFTDTELDELLANARVDREQISGPLRAFLRTPRVAAVALRLLDRLALDPSELTRERLLLEYWQQREHERGGLLAHSDADFADLLASHARAWRTDAVPFSLDAWATHSGLAARAGIERVRDDVFEIAEGRFLVPDLERRNAYRFRADALPFALGLLLMRDVREAAAAPSASAASLDEAIDTALAPIHGFDEVGDILAAAIGLACLERGYPTSARRALVRAWPTLQNTGRAAIGMLASYVPVDPDHFWDVLEDETSTDRWTLSDRHALLRAILAVQDSPRVRAAIDARVPQWLARWSDVSAWGEVPRGTTLLTMSERVHVTTRTVPVHAADAAFLHRAAVMLLSHRPLAPLAPAFVSWALADLVGADRYSAVDDVRWLLLLNECDPAACAVAIVNEIRAVISDDTRASEPVRRVFTWLLRTLSDATSTQWAERIDPDAERRLARSAARATNADPMDPHAEAGLGVEELAEEIARLPERDLWAYGQVTQEDQRLEDAVPVLARFAPDRLVDVLRAILRSARDRDGTGLYYLAFQLPWLAPLIDAVTAAALRDTLQQLHAGAVHFEGDADGRSRNFVLAQFTSVGMLHQEGGEQLALLHALPDNFPLFTALLSFSQPLPSAVLDHFLQHGSAAHRRWTLFAAGARPFVVSPVSRARLVADLAADDVETVAMAAHASRAAADPAVDAALLQRAADPHGLIYRHPNDDRLINAVAAAVHRNPTVNTLALLRVDVLPMASYAFGAPGVSAFDCAMHALLARHSPTSTDAAAVHSGVIIGGGVSDWQDAERRLLEFPRATALGGFVQRHPETVRAWCKAMMEEGSTLAWMHLAPFVATLAGALAPMEPALAVALLTRALGEQPLRRVTIDGVDVTLRACFAEAPALRALQNSLFVRCMTDAELEEVLRAAEAAGADQQLDDLCDAWLAAGTPVAIARALTITGLRAQDANEHDPLARVWGGLLGEVARAAQSARECNRRMVTWLERSSAAASSVDVWRYATLGERLADSRVRDVWRGLDASRSLTFDQFAPDIYERFLTRAKRRTEERRSTLFGLPAPAEDLRRALRG
ncbi:MAG: hypothetical protein K2R93_21415 [Gemmatimonadaceae bacterium]|nr:hypothetical protein [Gemmatimonadaceae bacterium]